MDLLLPEDAEYLATLSGTLDLLQAANELLAVRTSRGELLLTDLAMSLSQFLYVE